MLYPRSLTPNGLDREMGKKWLDYFLGGISRSARVIFFGRARLAHQRSGDRFVVAFRSCARDGYNRNEDRRQRNWRHGDGPPEHALEHKAAAQAHAGGEPDDAGADGTGSKQVVPTLTARALWRRVQAP
jgi:hypothetical protein